MKAGCTIKIDMQLKIFASYDRDEDTKEITFGDRTMIPLSCVKKMTKLK